MNNKTNSKMEQISQTNFNSLDSEFGKIEENYKHNDTADTLIHLLELQKTINDFLQETSPINLEGEGSLADDAS